MSLPSTLPAALLAAGEAPAFFGEVAAMVLVGVVIAYGCHRLGLMPIVGFLVAGVLIGPSALGLVHERELVDALAELGVILLLFTIGIEFSFERLNRMRALIFGAGGLQVALTIAAVAGCVLLGGVGWRTAIYSGFLVALSSTAIVLKVLGDRAQTRTERGQVSVGILIFQDLVIVPMVLLLPMLGGGEGGFGHVALALSKAALIIVVVMVVARRLMPPVLERVARTCSPELFLMTVIGICVGTAWLTSLAGVSLSLGAFLAGVIVSDTRFSQQAMVEVMPIQILFNAAFFMSVGMLLDLGFLVQNLPLVASVFVGVVVVKTLAAAGGLMLLGRRRAFACGAALGLAQVGEFSFVLERAGATYGLVPFGLEAGSQVLIASSVLLMALTPLMQTAGARIADRSAAAPELEPRVAGDDGHHGSIGPMENHVVVAGYGLAARRLTRVLHLSKVPFAVVTLSPQASREAEAHGYPTLYGDPARTRTLELAGVERAKALVVPDDDPAGAHKVARIARALNPTMHVVVYTRLRSDVKRLLEAGADEVIASELEGVVQLFADVLRHYAVAPEVISHHEELIRRGGYGALLEAEPLPAALLECELDEGCLDLRRVLLRPGAGALGRTLGGLGLDRLGLSAVALERGAVDVGVETARVLEVGDRLALRGPPTAFDAAAELFRGPSDEVLESARTGGLSPPPVDTQAEIRFEPEPRPGAGPDGTAGGCTHARGLEPVLPSAPGCEDCLALGHRDWLHLRVCLTCGHVGCCDDSSGKHASAHFEATGHPVMRSLEPGEGWAWCFVDRVTLEPARRTAGR